MQVLHERCAGIDVHKKQVVVTVMLTAPTGTVDKQTKTFTTMTADLLALADWLDSLQVDQVALESTGVYWYPLYNVLEASHTITLVNPQHMKAVPGRKTDVRDSEWIADLLRHGLLTASFIPPQPIRVLRELTRYRKTLVQERSQEINRLQQVLESANIKLAAVATAVLGVSGRAMLEALIAGEDDAAALAQRARGRLRAKEAALRQALEGRVQPHHRFLLRRILAHIDFLAASITTVQQEIETQLAPFAEAMTLLQTIPGIQATVAAAIVAEIGVDMTRFPSAKHLASWAGVCPGNKQSGGKRMQAGMTTGNPWWRGMLSEVVWSISHTSGNYLVEQYRRLARRRGKPKAIIAVAHTVLGIIYHLLRDKHPYVDVGADYFDKLDKARLERQHVRRLEQLGYTVTLTPAQAA
ncbi:MAG: IS110 family transposase [Ktedonobacterales bacterium]|nr:IS110 family transposase [Ktedonobacterales bacterium]